MAEIAPPEAVEMPALLNQPGFARLVPVLGLGRLVFRGAPAAEARLGAALGMTLPEINRMTTRGERGEPGARALVRFGPDELLLLLPRAEHDAVIPAIASACAAEPHALVDVSDRHQGFALEGPAAAAILATGCPLDLDPRFFPVGMATRSLFHKAEILLWRIHPTLFRIETGRSFAPYLATLIREGARDVA